MDAIIRAVCVYIALLVIFRLAGKRSLAQITTFDFVVLLIVGEAIQEGMIGEDFSLTKALLVVITLIVTDVGLSLWKQRSPGLGKLVDGVPLIIVENGRPNMEYMDKARVDIDDILTAARETQGLERMDQIKYAVLERNGGISIIPVSQT